MGTTQMRCANTAVRQSGMIPSVLIHTSNARPSTACGKKMGNSTTRW